MSVLGMPESKPKCNIVFTNVLNGDTVYHSLILIKGGIQCLDSDLLLEHIEVSHLQSDSSLLESKWAVGNCAFKALVRLHHGSNQLTFTYCGVHVYLLLHYTTRDSLLNVTPVYIVCQNDGGLFQAPPSEDNSIDSACRRIWVGCQLIQCLAAKKLGKTFQLSHDLNPSRRKVEVFHSSLSVDEARKMRGEDLWQFFGREIMNSSLGSNECKFCGFLSCTRYVSGDVKPGCHEEVLARTEAHVALGGGGLALLGCGCLHTWPETVEEVTARFLDQTPVGEALMDDSGYRGTYGGCFATTLGALCHELSHTFDLAHTDEGIMSRGFDNIHSVFTLRDAAKSIASKRKPWSRRSISFNTQLQPSSTCQRTVGEVKTASNTFEYELEDDIHWGPSCSALLKFHRWFNSDDCRLNSVDVLKFFAPRRMLTSSAGIRVVEIRDPTDLVIQSWLFLSNKGRDTFLVPSGVWCKPNNVLVAEDSAGNIVKVVLEQN